MQLCRQIYLEDKQAELQDILGLSMGKHRSRPNLLTPDDFTRYPQLLDFCLSRPLIKAATRYLGSLPILARMELHLSTPHRFGELISSRLSHRDPEDFWQIKLFVNIFDTDESHGPLTFLPADISRQVLKEIWREERTTGNRQPESRRYDDAEAFRYCRASAQPGMLGLLAVRCLWIPPHVRTLAVECKRASRVWSCLPSF